MASLAKTSERIASHRSCISSSLSQKKNKPRTSLSFLIFQNLFTLIIFNNFHKTLVSRHNFFIARRLIVKCLPIAYALYERPMPKKKKKKNTHVLDFFAARVASHTVWSPCGESCAVFSTEFTAAKSIRSTDWDPRSRTWKSSQAKYTNPRYFAKTSFFSFRLFLYFHKRRGECSRVSTANFFLYFLCSPDTFLLSAKVYRTYWTITLV